MSDLTTFDTEELQAELERREREKKEAEKPRPLESKDWSGVIKLCVQYVDELSEHGWADSDLDHYIYEEAMEAVFGANIWKWINPILQGR